MLRKRAPSHKLPQEVIEICRGFSSSVTFADPNLPDMPLIFVNPAYEKLTQWSASQSIGRNSRFLQGPLTDRTVTDEIAAKCQRREQDTRCVINYRLNGTPFLNLLSLHPMNVQENQQVFMGCQHAFEPTHADGDLRDTCERIDAALHYWRFFSIFPSDALDTQEIFRIESTLMRYEAMILRVQNHLIVSKVSRTLSKMKAAANATDAVA